MRNLITAELMKWRRTKFLWVTVAAAMAAPLLVVIVMSQMKEPDWALFLGQVMVFYTTLTGPLIVTLIGAQSIASEYQFDTWKLSLTAPVSRWQVYAVKGIVGLVWILGLTALAAVTGCLAGATLLNLTGTVEPMRWVLAFAVCGVGLAAMLPLHQLVTLLSRSFFVTSGVGIVATIAGFITLQSKYGGLYPLSGVLVLAASISGNPDLSGERLLASPAVWAAIPSVLAVISALTGLVYLQRADIR